MNWQNMKLRNKLYLGFSIVLVLLATGSIISYHGINKIKHQAQIALSGDQADSIQAQKDLDRDIKTTGRFIIVISIITIAAGLLLAFIISRSVSDPVKKVIEFTESLSQGDFMKTLEIDRKDEIGSLASALDSLVTSLRRMFRESNNGAYTLNASSLNLSSISEQMKQGARGNSRRAGAVASAAEEMSSNMNSVAAASEEASTNINMVATAAEQMTATINEIAQNTEKARSITEKAVSETSEASAKVDELGEAAALINKVTETINEISDQTNLLALNATIEAARAGEAGKGFAVVANEIKELARQTAEATQEIKEKVDAIQGSTGDTIIRIKKISDINNEVSGIVTQIANAIEEQSVTTEEIAQNVKQAYEGIQEVNQNVAQSSTVAGEISREIAGVNESSDEMAASSLQINISSRDLEKVANRMSVITRRYKIPEPPFDIGAVKGAHLQWRSRLEGVLSGFNSLKTEEVTNHHNCDFGKWYDGPDGEKLKDLPLFKEVGGHHEKIHTYARQIVDLVNRGENRQATLIMKEFEKTRGQFFETLNELYLA